MVWVTYKEKIKRLSKRIVDAQKPIRILDAIKWDSSMEDALRKGKFKQMPKVGTDHYANRPLAFDSDKKIEEFSDIISDI